MDFLTYFETVFRTNTIGKFKAPASTVARFNGFKTLADRKAAAENIANIYIAAASKMKAKQLYVLKFV